MSERQQTGWAQPRRFVPVIYQRALVFLGSVAFAAVLVAPSTADADKPPSLLITSESRDMRLQLLHEPGDAGPPDGPPPPWNQPEEDERDLHFLITSGLYASLGGPSDWGPTAAIELLPGGLFERWGLRGEWRAYQDYHSKSLLVSAIYEAGAARPKLALKLAIETGLSDDGSPIFGGGIHWSYWLIGPVGVSTYSDVHLTFDGGLPQPGASFNLSLHLGR